MASILIINDDGRLRARYRKLLERDGHTVSEISTQADRDGLPHNLTFHTVLTDLDPLPDDSGLDHLPLHTETTHADHSAH
ncbi:MAG: hypothetical protein ABL983_00035 [Nitrospira sp.]